MRTDNRGELCASGLMPGDYTVRASFPTIRSGRKAATASERADGFSPTYYPGTSSVADAQFVTLGIRDETIVQFAMVASHLRRVTGTIATSDGQPAGGMDLRLAPGEGESGIVYGAGTAAADGTFAITGVPDGAYTLQVRQNMRPRIEDLRAGRASDSFYGIRGESASVPLTVRGEDITGLQIVTSRGATISGRVVFEGNSTPRALPELRVFALPTGLAGGGWLSVGSSVYDFPPEAAVAADGRVQVSGVSRVQLDVPTADLMVTSIILDGREITDGVLDLTTSNSVSGVVITLTDRVSTVAGQVRGRDGQPVRNYVVVLLPRDLIEGVAASRWIHTSRAGRDGRFQIRKVRPGRYLAAAVEWMEPGRQLRQSFSGCYGAKRGSSPSSKARL